jgi:hypothetical protein
MLDDQAMADQWIIRVQGREFGPADLSTLREWRAEGRVLPGNEARRADLTGWSTAAEIPGLFATTPPPVQSRPEDRHVRLVDVHADRRSLGQILADTFRIYFKNFLKFFSLALFVILPSAAGQLSGAFINAAPNVNADLRSLVAGAFAFLMLVVSIVLWPIYVAAIQIVSAEALAGRPVRFLAALNEAVTFWPRVAVLCVFVYGVFFLLIMFAVAIGVMILASASSPAVILFALVLLAVQVWMFSRFFVSVLFWQQFAVIERAGVSESLHESKALARSGRDLPWFQRPLWRAAFIVSIWAVFVLAITIGPEWSTLTRYFHEFSTAQDPQALLQKLNASSQVRGLDLTAFAMGILQKTLQPLVGIAFVVLYFDSRFGRQGAKDSQRV